MNFKNKVKDITQKIKITLKKNFLLIIPVSNIYYYIKKRYKHAKKK